MVELAYAMVAQSNSTVTNTHFALEKICNSVGVISIYGGII